MQRKKNTKTKNKHTHKNTELKNIRSVINSNRKIGEIEEKSIQHDCRPFSELTIAVIIILITLIYIDF